MIYLAIVFLPLAGALLAGLFGRVLGARVCEIITTGLLIIAALLSWVAFVQVGFGHETARVPVARWITSGELDVGWSLRIDTLTVVMMVVVTTVSSLVHAYSIGYMHDDPSRPRFFAYLSLFTFAMLMLVSSDNLLQMFFGWEGVGLASYLLIGFWYRKPEANSAAIKAFIVNRVGDFGFAIGIFALFVVFNSINLDQIFAEAEAVARSDDPRNAFRFVGYEVDAITTICLLLFLGAMGKSAQFLLHTWLPDAMEGPTPVSALIHAATMVTAGVFMVARMSPLYELSPLALDVVMIIGTITAFFAATIGLVQNDIKRVIAYSTCSQLGYMFAACGVGAYGIAIFHLFTHAFFKALLFLGAGSVIHAMHHEQDMRNMGGLAPKIRVTWIMMLIGTLSLTGVGIPYLIGFAGFHSKDAIIEASYAAQTSYQIVFWVLVFTAFLTAFYSWRLIFMTFHGKPRAEPETFKQAHESPMVMLIPLGVLALGAVVSGFTFKEYFIGDKFDEFWAESLFQGVNNHILHDMHDHDVVPKWVGWMPFAAMLAGFGLSWLYYMKWTWLPAATARAFKPIYLLFLNKWYFDELYDWLFVRPAHAIGQFFWKFGDGRMIDGFIDGIAGAVGGATKRIVKLQSGYVYHYAFAMLIGVAILLTYFIRPLILGGGG